MTAYLVVFGVAALTTFVLTPLTWRMATRIGAVVMPDERRVHLKPTPTLGGLAMLLALLTALVVARTMPQFRPVFMSSSEPVGVALAALVIFAVGLLDDLREVSAPAKVAGQVLAASVLGLAGVTMFYFRVPLADFVVLSPDLGFFITVVWVVAMANAVNLIDGLDGLASGVVAIAAGAFFLYAYRLSDVGLISEDNVAPLIVAITCGLCVGFLPHNFHPAKVFMGDSGSMLLGLLLAASTIAVGGRTADQYSGQTYFFFAPLVIPFVILGVPFVDTAFAIIRRARRRTSLSVADKEHLHHRLMNQGHGPRRSVFILWMWTAILSGVVLVPTYTNQGNSLVPFVVIGLAVLLYTLFRPGVRQTEAQIDNGPPKVVAPPKARAGRKSTRPPPTPLIPRRRGLPLLESATVVPPLSVPPTPGSDPGPEPPPTT